MEKPMNVAFVVVAQGLTVVLDLAVDVWVQDVLDLQVDMVVAKDHDIFKSLPNPETGFWFVYIEIDYFGPDLNGDYDSTLRATWLPVDPEDIRINGIQDQLSDAHQAWLSQNAAEGDEHE